jgi:hypothetical protein
MGRGENFEGRKLLSLIGRGGPLLQGHGQRVMTRTEINLGQGWGYATWVSVCDSSWASAAGAAGEAGSAGAVAVLALDSS